MTKFLSVFAAATVVAACSDSPMPAQQDHVAAPTNRIDIPDAVRRNLGMSFAKVTNRSVAGALVLQGTLEPVPGSAIEARLPLAGVATPMVRDLERVVAGQPIVRVESEEWRALVAATEAAQVEVDALAQRVEACRGSVAAAGASIELFAERLAQLERVRAAGGASAAQLHDARAALQEQRSAHAEAVAEESQSAVDHAAAQARQASLRARLQSIESWAGGSTGSDGGAIVMHATRPGVVMLERDAFGHRVDAGTAIVRMHDPAALEVRAMALAGDVARLVDGSVARADPVGIASGTGMESLRGVISVAPSMDPASRSVKVVMRPDRIEPWAIVGLPVRMSILERSDAPQLSVPVRALIRDGTMVVLFRRDPKDPDRVIRLDADVGATDGAWTVIRSGLREGDEVVIDGAYQLMLASSGSAPKGGHFHADGTFHEGED
jgi:hypothetical protein